MLNVTRQIYNSRKCTSHPRYQNYLVEILTAQEHDILYSTPWRPNVRFGIYDVSLFKTIDYIQYI